MANEFVARKGLISSGSINVSGSVTASFFKGDGSQLTNLPSAAVLSSSVSIDTFTFSGDGATQNYILSQSYDVSSLFVSVEGLLQTNIQDYTLTGATLSFINAPPTSSNILVKALMNVTQNITGSFSGSFFGILASSSFATSASFAPTILPAGIVSSSTQINTGSFTGTFIGTSSWASNVISSSFATTASAATSITFTPTTASFAATASFVNPLSQDLSATGNITAGQYLVSNNSTGDEGGEILLAKPQTNSTISGAGVTIDVFQNRLRIFEQGGTARGGYWDITALGTGASTNLTGGAGTVTSVTAGSGLTGGTITGAGTITLDTGSAHFTGGVAKVLVTSASFATTSSFATSASFAPTILPVGVVSSSTQVVQSLPAGTVSSSTQQVVSTYTNPTNGRVLTSTGTGGINGESTLTYNGTVLSISTNGAKYFQGGDDAALHDVNIANTLGVLGVQDSTVGAIKLGSAGQTIYSDSTGVGIGTVTPRAKLHVQGNISASSVTGSLTGSFTGSAKFNVAPITLVVDNHAFVGNGVITNYTLSSSYDPAVLTVSVEGLLQTQTVDYTLSGTTLSFVTTPPTSSNIFVKAFRLALV